MDITNMKSTNNYIVGLFSKTRIDKFLNLHMKGLKNKYNMVVGQAELQVCKKPLFVYNLFL